jgi:[ribosomal protein S18]-alanine N-acetyltransferase
MFKTNTTKGSYIHYQELMPAKESISIVAACAADYCWCAQVMASTEPWSTLQLNVKECESALHRQASELFLALEGGQRLGLLLLQPHGLAGSPYIAEIAVVPEARGLGVGTKMLHFAEQRYSEARNIFLCVSEFNTGAFALYTRRGYKMVGELTDYVVTGHSELVMRKNLK